MPKRKFPYIIIGGGSAAFAAAFKAGKLGVKTLMVNDGLLGGTCVNVGCFPSKHLLRAAEVLYYGTHHNFPGIKLKVEDFSFGKVIGEEKRLVEKLRREKYKNVLEAMAEVELIADLATAKVQVSDILNMKVGDVIPLELDDSVTAKVDGVPVTECNYGTFNGQYALRVNRMLNMSGSESATESDDDN